jgi:cysteine desulfurase
VIEAMARVATTTWGNPASVHSSGRAARDVVETAREALAALLGRSARDVIFTSGGTEANNLALHRAGALVTSQLEHPSVTRVAELFEAQGRPVRWLTVLPDGRIEPEAVSEALGTLTQPTEAVVAIAAANHETGVIQPLAALGEVTHAAGARLHVDAVQALGKAPELELSAADTLSLSAHKLRGPKGIGALVHRPERAPKPLLLGGSQERGRRPGTVDPVAAAGLRVALEWAGRSRDRAERLGRRRDALERALVGWGGRVNGAGAPRLPHVTNLSFPAHAGDELVAALDLMGVAVASGSACSAGTTEPSKVISAMLGLERARGAVRISLGDTTTDEELATALAAFERALRPG